MYSYSVLYLADPKNNPGWGMPENETHVTTKLPLFMQPLLLDVTKQQDMKVTMQSYGVLDVLLR